MDTGLPAKLSKEELHAIRLEHTSKVWTINEGGSTMQEEPECSLCWELWPCDAAKLLNHIEYLEELVKEFL